MRSSEHEKGISPEHSYTFSTRVEKEALWNAVSATLVSESMQKVIYPQRFSDENQQENKEQNHILRKTALSLVRDLEIELDEQTALWTGLTPLISDEFLSELVDPNYNPNSQLAEYKSYARFLLDEKNAADGSGIDW